MDQQAVKVCSKCKLTKPLDAFGNDKSRPDRKNPRCKSCRSTQVILNIAPKMDHDHEYCIACIFGKDKITEDCIKSAQLIIEQYRKKHESEVLTDFSLVCNNLSNLPMHAVQSTVRAKLSRYLLGKLPDSEIVTKPSGKYSNTYKKLYVALPESVHFTRSDLSIFSKELSDQPTPTQNSMRIPYPCDGSCDNVIRQCCAEYFAEVFPSIKSQKLTYKYKSDYVLVKWPKKFALCASEINAIVNIISEKIIEAL